MMGLDLVQLFVFALTVIITGVSKSGFAGGLGVITIPILSFFMSPILAVALMLPTLLLMDIMSLRVWWGKQEKRMLAFLIPTGILGVAIGYLTFQFIDEQQILFLLGGVTLVFGGNGLLKGSSKKPKSDLTGGILGVVGGFTSFISHAGGPPLNYYLLSQSIDKKKYLATAVVYFAAVNAAKIPPYIALGQFTFQNLALAVIFSPIAFLGIRLGVILQSKLNETLFFKIIYSLLLVLGISLIGRAL